MRLPSFERLRVILLLQRFFRTSLLLGRMPSVMGGNAFRSNLRGTHPRAFEDAVLFVCDVERCLRSLEPLDQKIIAICVLEDRSEWEAARLFRSHQAHISRRLGEVLDLLHETFCRLGLLPPLPAELHTPEKEPSAAQKQSRGKIRDACPKRKTRHPQPAQETQPK